MKFGNDHMRLAASTCDVLSNREEKVSRLQSFISESLLSDGQKGCGLRLIAKSIDSPVAVALTAALRDVAVPKVALRVVLLETDGLTEASAAATLLDMRNADVRILQDVRFAAAHEQLTTGSARLWIGDCMRRDPAKRDAFELFHGSNAAAASHAEQSFDKLWSKAEPVKRMVPAGVVVAGKKTRTKAQRPSTGR